MNSFKSISVYPHHFKKPICASRAKYRDGRKDTAVKVYTVNQESIYLLITNVPAVGAAEQLQAYCDQYGMVDDFRPLDDYPTEEFTEAYLVKYSTFPSARSAKKHLDDKSFLGSTLHVFYAPEFETVQETSLKLQQRRKYVAWKTNSGKRQHVTTNSQSYVRKQNNNQQQNYFNNLANNSEEPVTYIWAGREYTVSSSSVPETNTVEKPKSSGTFVPRQCKSNASINSSNLTTNINYNQASSSSTFNDTSYENTILQVRSKISKVPCSCLRWIFWMKFLSTIIDNKPAFNHASQFPK